MKYPLLLPAGLLVTLIVGCTQDRFHYASPERANSIRWTPHVSLTTFSDLEKLDQRLDRPVKTVNGIEQLSMSKEGQQVVVTTCKDYLRYKQDGYHPTTNYDIGAESWFKAEALPLLYLKEAIPARESFVKDFDVTDHPLRQLPAELQLHLEGGSQGTKVWQETQSNCQVVVKDRYSIEISDDYCKTFVTILAWGDFNKDGYEDILLNVSYDVTQGTFHCFDYVLLTRKAKDQPLIVIPDKS